MRRYGSAPYNVAVVHGGPGAAGEMAPVARELSLERGVLEPLQTANSLNGQVQELLADLKDYVDPPLIIIGHSWGAWLSYIFTARHPLLVKKLILVASAPFEEGYASGIMTTRLGRLSKEEQAMVRNLQEALRDPRVADKDVILAQFGRLLFKADSFDPVAFGDEKIEYRYETFQHVWEEANALRQSGKLLRLGKLIACPVVAIHGDYDSHPPEGVEKPLSRVIGDFRFMVLEHCGHYPWVEREAKDAFYDILAKELR